MGDVAAGVLNGLPFEIGNHYWGVKTHNAII